MRKLYKNYYRWANKQEFDIQLLLILITCIIYLPFVWLFFIPKFCKAYDNLHKQLGIELDIEEKK